MSEKDIVGPDGPRGIGPELAPYLQAAQELDEEAASENGLPEGLAFSAAAQVYFEERGLISPEPEPLYLDADSVADEDEDFFDDEIDGEFDDELGNGDDDTENSARKVAGVENEPAASLAGGTNNLETDPENDPALAAKVEEIYQEIISRAPEHKVQPSLERVRATLDYMGDPQTAYNSVHVAGTNGKTSTARMVESLCRAWGIRTGLFTSPHLVDVRERICIDGHPISRQAFIDTWEQNSPLIELVDRASAETGGPRMSFFEVLTTLAFAAFADAPIETAVVEVGMGGRWDCTNVLPEAIKVITPVDLDHQKWLGNTRTEIAAEKAGIITPGSTVIVGRQDPEVMEVIASKAAAENALMRVLDQDFRVLSTRPAVGGQQVTIQTPAATYEDIYLPLFGYYQAENAACALAAFEALNGGGALPSAVVERGLGQVTSPGRLEVVRSSPMVLVDAAHNPHGAAALAGALETGFGIEHLVGVYSAMADKNIEATLSALEPVLEELVVVPMADNPRAASLEELTEIATEVFGEDRVHSAETLAEAVALAADLSEGGGDALTQSAVVVFGSVVLAGQAKELLQTTAN